MNKYQFSISRIMTGTASIAIILALVSKIDFVRFYGGLKMGIYPILYFFNVPWVIEDQSVAAGLGFLIGLIISLLFIVGLFLLFINLVVYTLTGKW